MKEQKRKYGAGKTIRKNFRFTEDVAGPFEDTAVRLGESENELASMILMDTLSDPDKFIVCPSCNHYVFFKPVIPIKEGVFERKCKSCGTHIWYDVDAGKVLKHKQPVQDG